MELWCFVTFGFHCMAVPGLNNLREIIFTDDDKLQMDLRLEYLPYEYVSYYIGLITKPGNQFIRMSSAFINMNDASISLNEVLSKDYDNAVMNISLSLSSGGGYLNSSFVRLIYSQSKYMSNDCIKKRCAIDSAWLKSYPPADDETTYRYSAANIKKQQHLVSFKDGDVLTVALGFKNLPFSNTVELFIAFDKENNSRILTHVYESDKKLELNKTFDQTYLQVKLCMNFTLGACGAIHIFPVILLQYDEKRTDQGCLATRCKIILDYGDENNQGTGEVSPALLVSIFLGVMAVLAALSVLVILRRRCRRQENSNESINRSQENDNEGIYASAQVTYAELQFSSESGNILRREEATPYAEIIGSCRPKADRN